MNSKLKVVFIIMIMLITGCNVSPLSPSNRPRINNSGDMGDIRNNQNGMMNEILNLKNRLDIMAQEIENLQNGLINSNNKNYGVQVFQGEGGLIMGFSLIIILFLLVINYKIKFEKYKKTAEMFGEKIKNLKNNKIEEEIFTSALAQKIEEPVYKILKM